MEMGQLNLLGVFNLFLCKSAYNNLKLFLSHVFTFQSALAENLTNLPCCDFCSASFENEVLNIYILEATLKPCCMHMVFIATCCNVKCVLGYLLDESPLQ